MIKIGVVGSRRRNTQYDKDLIMAYVHGILTMTTDNDDETSIENVEFVSGECPLGADRFIKEICNEMKLNYKGFPPNLPPSGSPKYEYVNAFYARNKQIADYVDVLVTLRAPDKKGGTENTIKYFTDTPGRMLICL